MANPNLLWVRDAVSEDNDVANPNGRFFNLLWKARTGSTIQGSDAALLAGDPRSTGSLDEPRAIFDRPVAPQDFSGALVKRIRLQGCVVYAHIPPLVPPATTGQVDWARAGFYVGVQVGNSGSTGYFTAPGQAGEQQQSVTVDWLWWERYYLYGPLSFGVDLATSWDPAATVNAYIQGFSIDTRCSRRLKEWDDTLMLSIEPSSGRTINTIAFSWSVLLEVPQ